MRKFFGQNVGGVLDGAQVANGRTVAPRVKDLYPVALMFRPDKPGLDGRRPLTLDATKNQRGELWFAKLDQDQAFLVDEARFVRSIRIHHLKLNPFSLSKSGEIAEAGEIGLIVPGIWQCPKCGKAAAGSLEQLKKLQGTQTPYCAGCSEGQEKRVALVRVPAPIRRVDINNADELAAARQMYAMFKAGSDAETPRIAPRMWAVVRVSDAPPPASWMPDRDDSEFMTLDAALREKHSTRVGMDGEIKLIQQHGVWVAPLDCSMACVQSPVSGKVVDSVRGDDGMLVLAIQPKADEGSEPIPQITVEVAGADAYDVVQKDAELEFGTPIATPKTWIRYEVHAAATLVVEVGAIVEAGERISEGFTAVPLPVVQKLGMSGVRALVIASTQKNGEAHPRFGWLSWQSMLGGAGASLGYGFVAAREPKPVVGSGHNRGPKRRENDAIV